MSIKMKIALLILFVLGFSGCNKNGYGVLFPNNQTYSYEALRTLGYTAVGGADINEIFQTVSGIRQGDSESWYTEWSKLAALSKSQAKMYPNDFTSSGRALLRASNYYRTAEFLLSPEDPRKKSTYMKCRDTFYSGLDALGIEYRLNRISYAEKSLETLYFPQMEGSFSRTLICMVNGYDSIKEETYFTLGAEALKRGYAFPSYDGPGQGAAIRCDGIPMIADWAPVNKAVLDSFLSDYSEYNRIVLVGYSLGSILATKAAASDPRIEALVHYDIFHDFSEAVGENMPESFRKRVFEDGNPSQSTARLLNISMRFSSETDWALRHGAWIFGKQEDYIGVLQSL